MKKLTNIIIASTIISLASSAQALYLELNPGYSNSGNATLSDGANHFTSKQDKHLGWNVNLGEKFLGLVGLEAGFTEYAKTQWQSNNADGSSKMSSYHFAIVLPHSLGPFFLVTKLGYGRSMRGSVNVNDIHFNDKAHANIFWGLGAGVYVLPSLYTALQYQQIQGRDGNPNLNITTLGLGYTF